MGKKSKGTHSVSNGGRQKANLRKEEKRQAKFAAKREAGKAYTYQPIEAKKGTREYRREKMDRAEKAKSSKLPLARWTSIMKKLSNQLTKEAEENKKKAEKATSSKR